MRLALMALVYVIVAPTVAGIILAGLLTTNAHGLSVMETIGPLMAAGFILALPVSYVVSLAVSWRLERRTA